MHIGLDLSLCPFSFFSSETGGRILIKFGKDIMLLDTTLTKKFFISYMDTRTSEMGTTLDPRNMGS
jgi:hypothetical protein